ncbi:hypothetical protein CPB84DRAFT_1839606 [Gymnopilus junonius]|uniref:MYND-type domain-containing protein n=1 Tax=Gymnopilus junonius TaxID=109634 RepID=A0A9P5N946_GYMJU|nr:hypothetical protein CPB84DRAFT_1839606 [Gymnopilus junonius]
MSSGLLLFQQAETLYHRGDENGAFEYYQKSIKKILKDENVTAKLPAIVPPDFPQELLGCVWRNFITAGLTLGVLAWDNHDRATAAKRYREAIDVANTYSPFTILPTGTIGWELYVHNDLLQAKSNLGTIVQNDTINAELVAQMGGKDQVPGRRDVVDLPVPQMRVDKTGATTLESSMAFATNACSSCGKRDPKLQHCSLCRTALYCNAECQKAHWPATMRSACCKPKAPEAFMRV